MTRHMMAWESRAKGKVLVPSAGEGGRGGLDGGGSLCTKGFTGPGGIAAATGRLLCDWLA